MKFSTKLMFSMTILFAVLFSIGCTMMIHRNFQYSLETASRQNAEQHLLECYAIESNMLAYVLGGKNYSEEKLTDYVRQMSGYAKGQGKQLALYSSDQNLIYSNIPEFSDRDMEEILSQKGDTYLIRKSDDRSYMLLTSHMSIDYHDIILTSAYDISWLFQERSRQLQDFLLLDTVILLLCITAIGILSYILTAPIKKLNTASLKIAQGAYQERTNVKSTDEIGQLSKSFNQMADAVECQIDELQMAVKQRDDFINAFSHEIKTPMTSIIGYSDILRTSASDKEKQLKYSRTIYQEGKRLEELSRKLMDLMMFTEENIKLEHTAVYTIAHRLNQQMEPLMGDLELSIMVEPAIVLADLALLDCLLRNLIVNAKKSEPKENVIEVYGKCLGDTYRFTVSDTGCGIPAEELDRICEPFYMVDKSRSRSKGGSGLGLFLCNRIVELHHTSLHFESEPGVGTSVSFELEVCKDV